MLPSCLIQNLFVACPTSAQEGIPSKESGLGALALHWIDNSATLGGSSLALASATAKMSKIKFEAAKTWRNSEDLLRL